MSTTIPSPSLISAFNVNNTLGALFVGEVLTSILYGISILQFYIYYRKSSSDHVFTKSTILLLLLLDTAHFVGYTQTAYFYGATSYMNLLILLETVNWSIRFAYVSAIASELLVKGIYAYRLCQLGGKYALVQAVVQMSVVCVSAAFGIVLVVRIAKASLPDLSARVGWILYVELALQAVTNIQIAVSLSLALWKMRTGIRKTDSLIHTLMAYTINTMALTSVVTIACIVSVAASPNTLIFMPVLTMHPKTMINSLLAFLNSRQAFRAMNDEPISVHLSNIRFAPPRSGTPPVALHDAEDIDKRDSEK